LVVNVIPVNEIVKTLLGAVPDHDQLNVILPFSCLVPSIVSNNADGPFSKQVNKERFFLGFSSKTVEYALLFVNEVCILHLVIEDKVCTLLDSGTVSSQVYSIMQGQVSGLHLVV